MNVVTDLLGKTVEVKRRFAGEPPNYEQTWRLLFAGRVCGVGIDSSTQPQVHVLIEVTNNMYDDYYPLGGITTIRLDDSLAIFPLALP